MSRDDVQKLRDLAAWHREFAEQTGNPSIWALRLRTAEDLEREAEAIESRLLRAQPRSHDARSSTLAWLT
jgi:hypothetical protein